MSRLGDGALTVHAWNADKTQVAVSPNSNDIFIYQVNGQDYSKWERLHVLSEHMQHVSWIDWSPVTNRIVSCSHDRNAYVWNFDAALNTWKPCLVILNINRAAMYCKWSHDGNKFAVASGMRQVCVCYYDSGNDWWISKALTHKPKVPGQQKHEKLFRSTVLCLDWHPSGRALATGCADFKCRVVSAYIREVDDQVPAAAGSVYGSVASWGELLLELDLSRSWVETCLWSPDGRTLALAGHDSVLALVTLDVSGQPVKQQALKHRGLPFRSLLFLTYAGTALVAAGHEMVPLLFTSGQDGNWSLQKSLDESESQKEGGAESSFSAVKQRFQKQATGVLARSASRIGSEAAVNTTRHQSCITCLCPIALSGNNSVSTFTSSGLDGKLLFWDTASLESSFAALRI
eukprot:GILI01006656.1.p1 GENE.GILI01006656.1~~GILI01006656.1.p1  ORF type:complete len:403 (-),score=108.56 GILI01006656.1:477-1685(-)